MIISTAIQVLGLVLFSYIIRRCLSKTSLKHFTRKWWMVLEDTCHVYQSYRVPRFDESMVENQLYRTVLTYLNSLSSVEDSNYANLLSSCNTKNDITILLDSNHVVTDKFLSARVYWTVEIKSKYPIDAGLVLKLRKKDKRRILRPYLAHIHSEYDLMERSRKEVRLYLNAELGQNGRWRSVEFTHPTTMDTIVMENDLKNKIKLDLEWFAKSKQYYTRLGRVWKRSYLLYGPSGTGKSSFIAAIAKFLSYDVYSVDLWKVDGDTDLKMLLLHTTRKSVIVVEDLDRWLSDKPRSTAKVSLSGVLDFMDGIVSGEERVMVYTMNGKEGVDPMVLRPGRIDVHVKFDLCDFPAFKSLANNYLGVKEHKLFPQVEEYFQTGPSLSPAEIGELMIANRSSPSRALKSVINALQNDADIKLSNRVRRGLSNRVTDETVETGSVFCKEGGNTMKEFRKLYGLLRVKSSRRTSLDLDQESFSR